VAEPDRVDESLALARRALAASASNKARVRALVDAGRSAVPDASRSDTMLRRAAAQKLRSLQRLKMPLAASALIGVGFVAGYWLGSHPEIDPLASGSASASAGGIAAPALVAAPSASNERDTPRSDSPASSGEASATSSHAPPRSSSERRPTPRPPPSPSAPSSPASPSRSAVTPAASGADSAPAPAPSDAFLDELALLARVDRAIRANQAELALTLLAELDSRHPRSSLIEERAAARLLADCLLAEPTARARAERFVRERAASVYVERVRIACGVGASQAVSSDPSCAEGSSSRGH